MRRTIILTILLSLTSAFFVLLPVETVINLKRITNTSELTLNLNPSLSGDGLHVAFESTADLANAATGDSFHALHASLNEGPVRFLELARSRLVAAGLTENASAIAFSSTEDLVGLNRDRNAEIFLRTSGQLRQVTDTAPDSAGTRSMDGCFQPSITDEGRFLVFSANRDLVGLNADLNSEVFLYDTTTEAIAQLTESLGVPGVIKAWISGDGSSILYLRQRGLNRDLLLKNRANGETRSIVTDSQSLTLTYGGAISDDGSRVVYSVETAEHQTQVFLYDTPLNRSRQITELGSRVSDVPLNASISGDGKRIAFATRRKVAGPSDGSVELYVYDIPTAQYTQVTDAPPSATAEVVSSLSNDGKFVAFNFPRVLSGAVSSNEMANNSEVYLATIPSSPEFFPINVENGAARSHAPDRSNILPRGGIAIARGSVLAADEVQAAGSFPFSLAGTTVSVNSRAAQLLYVSPSEVHFVIPDEIAPGVAEVVVTNGDGFPSRSSVTLASAAPGVFTKSGDGLGEALILNADTLLEGPLDPTSGSLRLTFFATGVKHAVSVTVKIAGQPVTIEAVVPSTDLPGLDEIHLLIPASLRGAGVVSLAIEADGSESNRVSVTLAGSSLRDIVINEILADPPDGVEGDANHDGVRSATNDEFIELVNATTRDLDLSGYLLQTRASTSSSDTLRHRFPAGTVLAAGAACVIFGGGNPNPFDAVFAQARVFRASTGGLSLANSGGMVTLRDASGAVVVFAPFGQSGGPPADANQSLTRFPDVTGTFVLHTLASPSAGRLFSPGTRVDGSSFSPSPVPIPTPTPTPTPSPTPAPSPTPLSKLVISQIYGGGGNAGAAFRNDFIEIFNSGTVAIDLSGWSMQYASATSGTWSVTNLTSRTLAPGQYYLIQEASGGSAGAVLPAPDAVGSIAMAATAGKVALVNGTTQLSGACPANSNISDLVGYGSSANCFRGSGPAGPPGNSTSIFRLRNGCADTQNNGGDFATGTPNPRNSGSAVNRCEELTSERLRLMDLMHWRTTASAFFRQ